MEQLISLVAQRAGIGEDKARTAVDAVMGFLKERLPGPMASQLDSLVGGGAGTPGGSGAGGVTGDVMKGLGGMTGKS